MKILVTGGFGFIGSAFIRWILQNPTFQGEVVNLDLMTYAANPENLRDFVNDFRYEFVHGDICDQPLVEGILQKGITAIVHFAAETHVDRSIQSAYPFIETNVKGTLSLLEAVRKFPKIHFHHVSTDEVFGSLSKDGYFNEQSQYQPNSPYSASKAASDHLVRAFANTYHLSTTISHCSNNYGPGQNSEKLIPHMIERLISKQVLPIYGKGTNIRDWLYVDDHAEAIWTILNFGKRGETYNIGGALELSNLEMVHCLIDHFSKLTDTNPLESRKLIQFVEDRPGHDFRYAIDASKIRKELGWIPKTTLSQGLGITIHSCLSKTKITCALKWP
ncbi:MAG TPA: dTDP-glucose 4,6-dehydratase [Chlamydiales bacterium]|nr:dTDP-glucose 4,6-dehydratase [Chlamydiales bacterium]